MAEIRVEDVIRRPLITEKNTVLMEIGQYTFEVAPEANKFQIREAVEKTFNVKVRAVNTLNVKPKAKSRTASRRGGRITGHVAGWKKAIVTLAPGDRIDLFEQV
ncbi:MAG: large subunit ribosomal protein [Thermomicrobiales bacterium]|nr:large subunit ribosomal protein [Thermomicrobiales bacterium]MEA2526983.1 large subunit ribosomal protein [Thermomicrobiales bacterium]MEA2529657.1 large subunit ribosomal protein [Thermomicrobiales bacterium]MEA2586846.1 large subunit ribosomal protein [Thermomicrobiales bacterium]